MDPSEPSHSGLFVCWTTVERLEEAERLARQAVESALAACAQIDSPITSVYKWEGAIETSLEYRVWFKTPESNLADLEALVKRLHPYETPQWLCARAEKVSEKYLKWVSEACNLRGF